MSCAIGQPRGRFQHLCLRVPALLLSSFSGAPAGASTSSNPVVLSRRESTFTRGLTHRHSGGTLRPMDLLPLRVAAIKPAVIYSLKYSLKISVLNGAGNGVVVRPLAARVLRG